MMRGGVLLQALAMAMVCGVATTAVAGILAQGEPAMRLTSQLSAPHATEEERDQLRREIAGSGDTTTYAKFDKPS